MTEVDTRHSDDRSGYYWVPADWGTVPTAFSMDCVGTEKHSILCGFKEVRH